MIGMTNICRCRSTAANIDRHPTVAVVGEPLRVLITQLPRFAEEGRRDPIREQDQPERQETLVGEWRVNDNSDSAGTPRLTWSIVRGADREQRRP
jgi:hypothetical protein